MPYRDKADKAANDAARWRAQRQSVQYDATGVVKGRAVSYTPDRDPYVPLPGAKLARRSTLVDAEGNVLQAWRVEKPEAAEQEAVFREWAKALAEGLPRAEPVAAPTDTSTELMACYPIGDHHLGMLSWKCETGASYDLDIGERLLSDAIAHLVQVTPACDRAVVVFLGDFMHYDSFESVTPTNRNTLDADGRFPKMVRVAVRTMRRVIETALTRHKHVSVIVEIGNHDLSSSIFLMECLYNIYEADHRIAVDTSPRHYHYFSHGKCLVGVHHGHGAKMTDLPGIMASDQPGLWGATEHRYWWTGHIHTQRVFDYRGCSVESFRILPPADAWAANAGYRAQRDMKAIVLHREHGEVARYTVNPAMLERSKT